MHSDRRPVAHRKALVIFMLSYQQCFSANSCLLAKSFLRKLGKHKSSLVDLLAVVFEQLVLLLITDRPQRLGNIATRIFGADHESNLSTWIGRNGGPSVLGDWEDLLAVFLELLNNAEVEPWILS